jgi:hypothetical protein
LVVSWRDSGSSELAPFRRVQHRQTPLIAGIPTARAPGFYARATPSGWNASYSVVSLTLVQNIQQARSLETALQYRQAALVAPLPSTSTRSNLLAAGSVRRRAASANPATKLTLKMDHSVGAGHTLLGAEDVDKNSDSDLLWQDSATGDVKATEFMAGLANTTFNLGVSPDSSWSLIASTGGG